MAQAPARLFVSAAARHLLLRASPSSLQTGAALGGGVTTARGGRGTAAAAAVSAAASPPSGGVLQPVAGFVCNASAASRACSLSVGRNTTSGSSLSSKLSSFFLPKGLSQLRRIEEGLYPSLTAGREGGAATAVVAAETRREAATFTAARSNRSRRAAATTATLLLQPPVKARRRNFYTSSREGLRYLSSSAASSCAAAASAAASSAATAAPDEEEAYHAGLIHTAFSHELHITKETPVIPIFRVLNCEGKLLDGWHSPFSNEEAVEAYQFMVKLSIWDNLFYNIQRQGRISFYIQNQGEEALQTGVGKVLEQKDHLFCQYRELGVLLLHGFTEDDVLDQLFARKGDESKGRQMPISYSKRSINLQTICTPLTTQVPHAAGAGYAFKVIGDDCIAVAFFGEGAASEGDFHAAMNFAATLKSQTLFACRNNGYAISTPVKDQYAGDGIAIRGIAYGMRTVRVDGNDLFACYLAAKRAREIILAEGEPVLIEFMTYRVGHHSTSDDSMQYRPQGELEKWNRSGVHPIARMRRYLENNNLWTDQQDEELRKDARSYILQKLKAVEKHKRWPVVAGIFDDVYDKEPWHLKEQREEFTAYVQQNQQFYPQLKEFESLQ